ncbi:MAG: A/G-specific adenine glycosylase [Microgenomates group bacterium]
MHYSSFQTYIQRWYNLYGRHELPWRQTTDPYHILVSELMLQQTQVERVVPKYTEFLLHFPNTKALASASLADVLKKWQGLGYNRRAKYLHKTAQLIVESGNSFPNTHSTLLNLPGVGNYTAAAIMNFAFDEPTPLIETNIRTVYLYHFFPDDAKVSDVVLLPLVEASLDYAYPREWFWALMDYGAYIKKVVPNPSLRSAQHIKQSKFSGSKRQVRGAVIRHLSNNLDATRLELELAITGNLLFLPEVLLDLQKEKLIEEHGGRFSLAV